MFFIILIGTGGERRHLKHLGRGTLKGSFSNKIEIYIEYKITIIEWNCL
jgi:hypothetical protein